MIPTPTLLARFLTFALFSPSLAGAQSPARDVQVFILAGQSNMEGKGFPEPVAWQITSPEHRDRWTRYVRDGDFTAFTEKLEASLAADPQRPVYDWSARDDVWIEFLGKRGPLTVGYGVPSKCFGPELEFGYRMGDRFEEPVLLIKAAWGGKSLGRDFRPPSAMPSDEELVRLAAEQNDQVRAHNEKNPDKPREEITVEAVKAKYGHFYREMLREVRETLADLPARFPELADATPKLAGFVWFQGWNDQFDPDGSANYGEYMAHFVRDVRRDLAAPALPFVIGVVGFDGQSDPPPGARAQIQAGQRGVAALPEFAGTVRAVETAGYWDMDADAIYRGEGGWSADPEKWRRFGNDRPYHYYGSPWFFAQAGRGFGDAMLELLGGR